MPAPIPGFMPALIPALVPALLPALVSHSGCPAILSSRYMSAFVSRSWSSAVFWSCCVSALAGFTAFSSPCYAFNFYCTIPALLLLFPSILGPSLLLRSSSVRIFKQSLSDKLQLRISTSIVKYFCSFSILGMYNPYKNNGSYNQTNNNKCKRGFDIIVINSRPLAGNHY